MWYYAKDGRQEGPVSEEQLRTMARSGGLGREDLVWRDGMADWQPAGTIPELGLSALPAYSTPPPPPVQVAPPPPPPSPYAPPQAQYGGGFVPPPPVYGGVDIPNYLPWAIVATLLCCLPTGVASIVYASRANSAKAAGDYAGASQAAGQAKTWLILSFILGVLLNGLFILASVSNQMGR